MCQSRAVYRLILTSFDVVGLVMTLLACRHSADSIVIELEEVNGSGVSGELRLEPAGQRWTRITVNALEGGEITGARVMPGHCDADGLDDKYPITPPSGIVQVEFERFREWSDEGPIAAEFMRRGRSVACGES